MELFLLHCNSHGIDDEIESIIFIALELLLLSWLDLRLAHGSRFLASLSFSHRKASFSLSSWQIRRNSRCLFGY